MTDAIVYTTLGDSVEALTTLRQTGRDRGRLCQLFAVADDHLIIPHQTHTDRTAIIDEAFLALSTTSRKEALEGIDAVITQVPEVVIGVSTADCIPLLLHDPRQHVVAAVHAGWRGTVARIGQKTIDIMAQQFHTDAADLRAVIGPGISMPRFEVGQEVYDAFQKAEFPMDMIATRYEKWHLDLWKANRWLLEKAGVKSENIHIEDICTYDSPHLFSARREQTGTTKCGRNFNAIKIKADD